MVYARIAFLGVYRMVYASIASLGVCTVVYICPYSLPGCVYNSGVYASLLSHGGYTQGIPQGVPPATPVGVNVSNLSSCYPGEG